MDTIRSGRRPGRLVAGGALAIMLGLGFPEGRAGHEIPADVTVRAFVAPRGETLRVAVRVPLTSMRDVIFPVRGPGYLDIPATRPLLVSQASLWIADYVSFFESGQRLPAPVVQAARLAVPSDPSFATLDRALEHLRAPGLADETELVPEQAMLDVLLTMPISSDRARLSVDPEWAHLGIRTSTVLRFVTPEGVERAFQYDGNPGLVQLDPRWHQAFFRFVVQGFAHILDGIDHLLFLLCLVIPVRRFWALVPIVTAFTAAHSITLIASVLGLAPNALWFPPLIETLIAASIVYMAIENILGRGKHRRRWIWAFGFGLIHGFGFSFALRGTLQFAGSHLLSSLLAFNVGVEIGQLAVLLVMVPVLAYLFSRVPSERMGQIVISALVAHTGWHWMTERGGRLLAYDIRVPPFDVVFLAVLLRWALLLLIVLGTAWALSGVYGRLARRGFQRQDTPQTPELTASGAP